LEKHVSSLPWCCRVHAFWSDVLSVKLAASVPNTWSLAVRNPGAKGLSRFFLFNRPADSRGDRGFESSQHDFIHWLLLFLFLESSRFFWLLSFVIDGQIRVCFPFAFPPEQFFFYSGLSFFLKQATPPDLISRTRGSSFPSSFVSQCCWLSVFL